MTEQDKHLLLLDLKGRLKYGVKCIFHSKMGDIPAILVNVDYENGLIHIRPIEQNIVYCYFVEDNIAKPYLRPLKSMSSDEDHTWMLYRSRIVECNDDELDENIAELHNWFNRKHFDYRGLIEKGLAIEVNENNNPYTD